MIGHVVVALHVVVSDVHHITFINIETHLQLVCPLNKVIRVRSSEARRLLLDLKAYGGTDPLGMFPLFLKRTADVMALRLTVVFRRLVRLGSFPACWRQANVTP